MKTFRSARNVVTMPRGTVILAEGEQGNNMYVLIQGRADISVGGEVLESAVPGALLGEMALVSTAQRSATVMAERLRRTNERLRLALSEISVRGRRPR